jgi:CRISPR system Cascade subunit CasA
MKSPIIRRVDGAGTLQRGDLYETFAALSRGEIDHLPALRPHQAEIWHMFTVQVAVLAMENAGLVVPPEDAQTWRDALHGLTPTWPDGEPWHLVVDDLTVPALLQPAVRPSDLNAVSRTPDQLDVIVTGRNHDVKDGVSLGAEDDDWLFALVTLQTSEGSMGAGSQPVSRINGGYASRSTMRLVPPGGASASFLRDVRVLLRHRREDPPPRTETMLWTLPWPGDATKTLDALSLDPLYIEVCRRVRLVDGPKGIQAKRTTPPRIPLVRSERGQTNCPWTPIVISDKGDKSFSPGPVRDKRVPVALLDRQRTMRPLLAEAHLEDVPGGEIAICGLRRGQGATERFDVYRLPLPDGDPADAMARMEITQATRATARETAWTKLRTALIALRQGAPDRIRFDDAASSSWAEAAQPRYSEATDAVDRQDIDPSLLTAAYGKAAHEVFDQWAAHMPGASTPRGLSTTAKAKGLLEGMIRKSIRGESDDK